MTDHHAKIPYLCGCNANETGNMDAFRSTDPARIPAFAKTCFPDDVDGYLNTVDTSTAAAVEKAVFEQYNSDKLCALLAWQALESRRDGDHFWQYYYTKPQPGADCQGPATVPSFLMFFRQ